MPCLRPCHHGMTLGLALLACWPLAATALPSFAQQTGQPCSSCHTLAFGPGLTPFGQQFKLNGYVGGDAQIKSVPLAAMLVASLTHTQAAQAGGAAPDFNANNNIAVDEAALFYAGRITPQLGAFLEATYEGVEKKTAWDNVDVRYANHLQTSQHNLVWGLSLNNSPTVQDLWNSTPAWSFPYVSSALAPTPAAAPLLEDGLAQKALGLTAYTLLDNSLYLEAGAYHRLDAHTQKALGVDTSDESTLLGSAPYWRAVLQKQAKTQYVSLGVFGMVAKMAPGGDASAGSDRLTDLGYDATYQYGDGWPYRVVANLTYLHELQRLSASDALHLVAAPHNQLNTLRFNVGWIYQQTWSLSGGPFLIRGGDDAIRYAPGAVSGSANGSPNSRGLISQLEYVPFGKTDSRARPWLNLRLGLQYTTYTRFNGGSANYDGSGRSAKDNNTLFAFMWWAL